MTTPLEAQDLAKRLRARADTQIDDNLTYIKEADALMREAAAFLEHPVNTGQGVTEEEVERAFQAYLKSSESETQEELIRPWVVPALRAAIIAARTPLASVEGDGWKLVPIEMTDEMVDEADRACPLPEHYIRNVYRAAVAASPSAPSSAAQSGRSSAEPVAWDVCNMDGEVVRTYRAEAHAIKHLADVSMPRVIKPLYYAAPPVGPQEAVSVKALIDNLRESAASLPEKSPAAVNYRRAADALSALSPSGIDLGGEVERLTRERDEAMDRIDELEREAGDVASEFEGQLTGAVWALLRRLDADMADGFSVQDAVEWLDLHIRELRTASTTAEALASLSNAVREGDDA